VPAKGLGGTPPTASISIPLAFAAPSSIITLMKRFLDPTRRVGKRIYYPISISVKRPRYPKAAK
jgi:hypothetical protein